MKVLILLFVLLNVLFSFSQEIKPKCLDGNCKNKIGTFIYSDSSIYVGSFVDKLRSGQGKITSKNKSSYDGQWLNDKRNGFGVFIDSLGNKYEGNWVDDKENGIGKYTSNKGNLYEGTWTNGVLRGNTTIRFRNKNLYIGEFDNGLHGNGKLTYADGSIYSGNFNRNNRSGYGEMVYIYGITYKGNWLANEIDGQGQFYLTSSQVKIADGVWKTDKTNPTDNKFISADGYMICYYANKNLYYGKVQDGVPSGAGIMKYANGDVYEGNFVKGIYNGNGRLKLKDNSEYSGEWKNGKKDGYGTLTNVDKSLVKGYWKDDSYLGTEKPIYTLVKLNCEYGCIQLFKDCQAAIISKSSEEMEGGQEDNFSYLGLIDFNGKMLLELEFEIIHRINNSCLFLVKKKGSYYLYKFGTGLIPFNYKVITDNESQDYYERMAFHDGLCQVKDQNGKIGFIDETGKELIKCSYFDSNDFSEGLCSVYNGTLWGIINKKGDLIVPYSYSKVSEFSDGMALVVKDGKYGYIDKQGKLAIPLNFKYEQLEFYNFDFEDGLAINYEQSKGYRFIDKSGKFVGDNYSDIDSWFHLRSTFELFSVEKTFPPETASDKLYGYTKKYGIVNSQGILVSPIIYSEFKIIDNFILTMKQDKFGLIDSSGKLILEAKYTEQQVYSELYKIQPKKEFKYERVYEGEKVGLINSHGQVVLNPIYDKINPIEVDKRDVDEGDIVRAYKCLSQGQCYIVIF